MNALFDRSRKGERALLVQPHWVGQSDGDALTEFSELARSAGATIVGSLSARIERPNPKYFVGSGKAEEIKSQKESTNADLVLVNHALSPVQERNLEALTQCRVVDRTGLILDIFAQRARSHEGKLQVELAQLKHMATRLVRGWTHLERQRGGAIGLRGPGETQLELDRRLLAGRVKQLTQRLRKVDIQRTQARRARQRNAVPVISLVGYTNAGKSTLFNALTDANVYVADQLFATLDPTLRRIEGLSCGPAVLADTVGFISDLPHDLVAAFKSTLAETRDADMLLHVVDAADPEYQERIVEVQHVLEEIGAQDVPQILVFNKIDKLRAETDAGEEHKPFAPRVDSVDGGRTERVWISAAAGRGLNLLRDTLGRSLQHERVHCWLRVPDEAGKLRARLFEQGLVANERPADSGWELEIDAPRALIEPLFGTSDGPWLKAQLNA